MCRFQDQIYIILTVYTAFHVQRKITYNLFSCYYYYFFFFFIDATHFSRRFACDGVWSAKGVSFGDPFVATWKPWRPSNFETQKPCQIPPPSPPNAPPPPLLIIQNRGQHKHTNQCLISFTKGMLTLLKGHWKIAYARVSADYAISMYLYLFSFTHLCTVPRVPCAPPPFLSLINEGVARVVVKEINGMPRLNALRVSRTEGTMSREKETATRRKYATISRRKRALRLCTR